MVKIYSLSFFQVLMLILLVCPKVLISQTDLLLPKPQKTEIATGKYYLANIEAVIASMEKSLVHGNLEVKNPSTTPSIQILWKESLNGVEINQNEAYNLVINGKGVCISAVTKAGVFYALQTLKQLADINSDGNAVFPYCHILDWPAFRIRGFMHDVGRSFIPVEELKKQIKILSGYKINVFHWHFTEDLAWRLESKIFPELTAFDNFERFPGKYYSQEDVKELLAFAKAHHVTVIPEIDMPGHSAAFERAFGYSMQTPEGKEILKKLLLEAGHLFKGLPYFHIGTDEVGFSDPDFVPEMVAYVRDMGFKVVSWNPGWNYASAEIDMLHLWSYQGKSPEGVPFVDSRFHYVNHFDPFADLVGLYRSNVAGHSKGSDTVLGSILAIWNDRMLNDPAQILRENNFYPSAITFAERLWQGGGDGYFDEIGVLLPEPGTGSWDCFVDFENRLLVHRDRYFDKEDFPYFRQQDMEWLILKPLPNNGDLSLEYEMEKELKVGNVPEGILNGSKKINGAGTYLRHVWGPLIPGAIKDPQANHTAFVLTNIYSPKDQVVNAAISFQDYSRSEKDLPPPQGKWDWKESKVWLNGEEIPAPEWVNKHSEKTNEIPLENENWQSRPPVRLILRKGRNPILLKLPVGQFQTPELRLVKWMFNFAVFGEDGKEVEGLIYDVGFGLNN